MLVKLLPAVKWFLWLGISFRTSLLVKSVIECVMFPATVWCDCTSVTAQVQCDGTGAVWQLTAVYVVLQNTLYYDAWWVGQHVCLVWLSGFVMYSIHYLPAKYVDVLHSCALHLGRWIKVEGRHAHVPYNAWVTVISTTSISMVSNSNIRSV